LQYDANGNLTSDGVNTYTWDARNRLVSISGGATANFVYDPLGRRTSKTINIVASQFLYDGNDIAAEIGGGAVGANYLRSLNIDEPFIRQSGTGTEHYHADALGSSLALSNAQGSSATVYTYEPFGKTTVSGSSSNAFQYTGRENDGTGLYSYRSRYYSPIASRFISEDPIGIVGGFNFYSYVRNNAINNLDPLGLCVIGFTTLNGDDGILIAATNDGNLSVGPFPATNRATGNGPIPNGTYNFQQPRRQGHAGVPTSRGLDPFEGGPRTRQQALGDAFIPIDTSNLNNPARTDIGIHAKFPDPGGRLSGTKGCIRIHNTDVNDLADFIEQNCKNEPNTFIKQ